MRSNFNETRNVVYTFTATRNEKTYTLEIAIAKEKGNPYNRAFVAELSVTGADGKDFGGECYRDAHLEWSEFHPEADESEFDKCEWELYLTYTGDDGKEPTTAEDQEAIEYLWQQYEKTATADGFLR